MSLFYQVFLQCLPPYGLSVYLIECLFGVSRRKCIGWSMVCNCYYDRTFFLENVDKSLLILALLKIIRWCQRMKLLRTPKTYYTITQFALHHALEPSCRTARCNDQVKVLIDLFNIVFKRVSSSEKMCFTLIINIPEGSTIAMSQTFM